MKILIFVFLFQNIILSITFTVISAIIDLTQLITQYISHRFEMSQIKEIEVASNNPILHLTPDDEIININQIKNENLECTLGEKIKRENKIENKRRKEYHERIMSKFNKNNLTIIKKNAELDKAIKENIRIRLNNRFEFLKNRINLSEECRVGCVCAVGDYITAHEKDYSVDDIICRRKKLSEEVRTYILCTCMCVCLLCVV